ncbi:hypothetical protein [Streptomyces sp. NPDC048659]|uniref:hypothetical protein n=1 Tax=Streptomyces sp. NPDC048659 TaxID=3155489 RepID=UPI00342F35D3
MTSVNAYTVESPSRDFTGESVGVHFHKGTGLVDDSTKEGRAAIEYFRRQGYVLVPEAAVEVASPAEAMAAVGAPVVSSASDAELFDPAAHDVPDVLAYLDALGTDDSDASAEFDRILAAEQNGKARKTILARSEQKQEEQL